MYICAENSALSYLDADRHLFSFSFLASLPNHYWFNPILHFSKREYFLLPGALHQRKVSTRAHFAIAKYSEADGEEKEMTRLT